MRKKPYNYHHSIKIYFSQHKTINEKRYILIFIYKYNICKERVFFMQSVVLHLNLKPEIFVLKAPLNLCARISYIISCNCANSRALFFNIFIYFLLLLSSQYHNSLLNFIWGKEKKIHQKRIRTRVFSKTAYSKKYFNLKKSIDILLGEEKTKSILTISLPVEF